MTERDPVELDEITTAPSGGNLRRLMVWLLLASLLALLLPLYLVASTIQDENAALQADLESIQATLDAPVVIPPAEQALRDEVLRLRTQSQALEALGEQLQARHVDWPEIMILFGNYDPTLINLTAITQEQHRVVLSGHAQSEALVMSYSQMLRDTGRFTTVLIQAISQRDLPTPTPLPLPRGAPTAIPPTPIRVAAFTLAVELPAPTPVAGRGGAQ